MRGWVLMIAAATLAGCAAPSQVVRPLLPPPPAPPEIVTTSPARLAGNAPRVAEQAAHAGVELARKEVAAQTDERAALDEGSGGPAPARRPSRRGRIIAGRAASLVGVKSLRKVSRRVPDDCTGVPRLAYERAGIDLYEGIVSQPGENGVTAMYRRARAAGALHKRTPKPGDLVFFRETYDRNRDGRRNDGLTHIGVVESVSKNGTVVFVHRGSKGVARAKLNLRHPYERTVKGEVVNDYLRSADRRTRAYLTGELFSSYASPDRF